jgi:hypothetical protein
VDHRLSNGCPGMRLIATFPADLYWRRGGNIAQRQPTNTRKVRHRRRPVLLLAFGGPVANLGATLVDTQRITYGGASFRCWCVAVEFHCQI